MNDSLSISKPLADSFVKRPVKLLKTNGAGEAKFYIGSTDKIDEYNNFFNQFSAQNTYYFKKQNLLEFLLKEKFEFCYQFINQYKEVSLEYWDSVYQEVLACPEEISFHLTSFNDERRFYIRSASGDIFNDLVRRISLPLISILTIEKENPNNFLFTLDVDFTKPSKLVEEEKIIGKGYNKIIYGAPGAGKSASVSEIVGENYIRTVFHPETQYSDFIGCLKPHKDNGSGSITYSFRKGPFIQILVKALLDPNTNYFLVIEELNRANTAAVFGEVFQLLDRDKDGKSEYPILIQDEDLYDALMSVTGLESNEFISKRQLIIPSNLSIIATMNSSDQAVFPLDTAFKRRWIFKYLPIDFMNCASGEIPIYHTNLPKVEWKILAQAINTVLVQLKVQEDKLIGPWFIKDSDLTIDTVKDTLIGKICSYLWDDALKYKSHNDEIFKRDIHSYGQLHQIYSNGEAIFSEKFIDMLKAQQDADERVSTESE